MKKRSYTNIDNDIFKDPRLSLKAVGLLCKLLSLPPGWKYSKKGLASICKDGKKAISTAIDELIKYGYLVEKHGRDKNGKFYAEYMINNNSP